MNFTYLTVILDYLKGIIVLFIFLPSTFFSQIKDTVKLNEVILTGIKQEQFRAGRKIQNMDSIAKLFFNTTNLAELMAFNSSVFIKNYGPQNLATSSFRGGNASQTAVLWNGFNIQNSMLGQNDFALLPNFIFDDINLEYGGSTALWGSGAVGGNVQLTNKSVFNKGFETYMNVALASFDTKKFNSLIRYSTQKVSVSTKVYNTRSDNDFSYIDTVTKKMKHSNYTIKGILQELSFIPGKNQKVNARAWYNLAERNFASTNASNKGGTSQQDENLKLSADWKYEGHKLIPAARMAYFNDALNYTDSLAGIFSKNKTKTFISEMDLACKVNKNHKFYSGVNLTNYQAATSNYIAKNVSLSKLAFLFGYCVDLLNGKWRGDFTLRQEFSSAYKIPLTGGIGLSYQASKNIKLKTNAAKVYRLPTLNDLYWINGGNPELKPEDGYSGEAGIELKKETGNFGFNTELTYFNKQIKNWITWVPGPNGNATPMNVLMVYSRGTETSSNLFFKDEHFLTKLTVNTTYVLSTSLQSALANDASLQKQLIYTPRYNYNAALHFVYYDLSMMYYHSYTGYRFITSDNTEWLKPYQVAGIKFAYTRKIEQVIFTTAFHINNLFNTNYVVIAQHPLPLRNYEISITLTYKQKSRS